ncbi:MAG: HipA domain-containing protein [Acidimicrobiia bacterium]
MTLEVRREGELIARLRKVDGRLMCEYDERILEEVPGGTPLLSCSLPVSAIPRDASAWARGLLPEGNHLARLAAAADVAASDTLGLLRRYGRDVAGAFEITSEDAQPRSPSFEVYSAAGLADEVDGLEDSSLGIREDSELSIAGLQDKLLVVRTDDGRWARPRYGYPSTHILKRDSRTHPGLVAAECASLRLARSVGLSEFDAWLEAVGDEVVLFVERFDRRITDSTVTRLHQEDLLQALGISPDAMRGRAKYQASGSLGPPSWWHMADLLDTYGVDRERELERLFRSMLFTLLVGNADAHAKNLALILEDGFVTLAPLYDIAPTQLWPRLRGTLALSIGDKFDPHSIFPEDLLREAAAWGYNREAAWRAGEDLIGRVKEAIIDHDALAEMVAGNIDRLLR